ncbi:hypothetical protein C8Q78DRAFT_1070866 [Trametes maxima]|nr:hypothetical protein C8Q78DRAFT_1070866 [Trametes maxima]
MAQKKRKARDGLIKIADGFTAKRPRRNSKSKALTVTVLKPFYMIWERLTSNGAAAPSEGVWTRLTAAVGAAKIGEPGPSRQSFLYQQVSVEEVPDEEEASDNESVQANLVRGSGATHHVCCTDCHHPEACCASCVLRAHRHRPFDRILAWHPQLRLWEAKTMRELGFIWSLGHAGERCPYHWEKPHDMVIIHEHGITDLPVRFCRCEDAPHVTEQLLQVGLWPATWDTPRMATTLTALRTFHGLELQGQLNVHDYLSHLARATDDVSPQTVKDRYREFNNSMRVFRHIHARRSAGLGPEEPLGPGSLAVLCSCCPQPGINMRPGWETRDANHICEQVLIDRRYLDALHYSIDGNFHLGLKDKKSDPNDVALSEGAAYFVNSKDFQTFLKRAPKPANEETTCNQFGAMGYGKYKGKVSGVIAITCRPMFMLPGGIVDLLRAEQYLYVDFALVSCLQRYLTLLLLMGAYDIHCQYIRNLRKRLQKEFEVSLEELDSIVSTDLPEIVAGVGKYHLCMHKGECRYKHSLHFLPSVGMTDGETLERIWAVTNVIARQTKEMSAGHRHDVLNDHYSDLNLRRVQHLVDDLVNYLETAEEHFASACEYIDMIETSIEAHHHADLDDWRKEESEWKSKVIDISKHNDLPNPYEPPPQVALTSKAIAAQLKAEHLMHGDGAATGIVGAVEQIIKLQDDRKALLERVEDFRGDEKARSQLAQEVEVFRRQKDACRHDYEVCIKPAIDVALKDAKSADFPSRPGRRNIEDDMACGIPVPWHEKGKGKTTGTAKRAHATKGQFAQVITTWIDDLDEEDFPLPSDLHSDDVEYQLRQGEANEPLDRLRLHLSTHLYLVARKKQGSGVIHNAEADRRLREKRKAIASAQADYREARQKMLVLGMDPSDGTFRVLDDDDCRAFVILEEERQLGDSYRTQSWIWGDFTFAHRMAEGDMKKFVYHSIKAHWFRQSALKTRWEEEVCRALNFFRHEETTWRRKAEHLERLERRGAAAAACRYDRFRVRKSNSPIHSFREANHYTRFRNDAESKFPATIYQV